MTGLWPEHTARDFSRCWYFNLSLLDWGRSFFVLPVQSALCRPAGVAMCVIHSGVQIATKLITERFICNSRLRNSINFSPGSSYFWFRAPWFTAGWWRRQMKRSPNLVSRVSHWNLMCSTGRNQHSTKKKKKMSGYRRNLVLVKIMMRARQPVTEFCFFPLHPPTCEGLEPVAQSDDIYVQWSRQR